MDYQERKILVIIKKLWVCSIEFCLQSKAVDIPSLASFGDGDTRK